MSVTLAPLLWTFVVATAILLGGIGCQALGAPIGRARGERQRRKAATCVRTCLAVGAGKGPDVARLLQASLAAAPQLAACIRQLDEQDRERVGVLLRPVLQTGAEAATPRRHKHAARCLRVLAELPSPDLAPVLLQFVESPDARLAHLALTAIGRAPEHYGSTLVPLAGIVRENRAVHSRLEAAWAFKRVLLCRLESAPMLLEDMSPAIWPLVAGSVSHLAGSSAEVLDAFLRAVSHPHPACREAACTALADVPDRRAFDRLAAAVHDHSPDVRLSAANALGRRRDPTSIGALIAAAASADERGLRAIAHALERLHGVPVDTALMGLGQAASSLRVPEIRSLGLLGTPDVLPVLVSLLADDSASIRRAGARAIAAVWRRAYPMAPDAAALNTVLARFGTEQSPDVIGALIEAIESSADPRASPSLVGRIPLVDAALRERLVDATAMLGLLERRRERSAAALGGRPRTGTSQ